MSDIAAYNFPEKANGVFSIGVFGYITEYVRLIKTIANTLSPESGLVIAT